MTVVMTVVVVVVMMTVVISGGRRGNYPNHKKKKGDKDDTCFFHVISKRSILFISERSPTILSSNILSFNWRVTDEKKEFKL